MERSIAGAEAERDSLMRGAAGVPIRTAENTDFTTASYPWQTSRLRTQDPSSKVLAQKRGQS